MDPPEGFDSWSDECKRAFERLKAEFSRFSRKNTIVQSLKQKVEQQLQRMVEQNPQRMNLYERYQQIIADYNKETDRATVEQTFAEQSHGFRPGHGCKDALREVRRLLEGGWCYVVDADLRKCFDVM